MLRLIYGFFETKQALCQVFGLTDLLRIQLQGDNLEIFLNSWLHVLNNLKNPASISDEAREELFLVQCEKSRVMVPDVEHYKRLPRGDKDRCYAFLLERLQTRIKDDRERRNRSVLERSLSGASPPDTAAPGPETQRRPCRDWKKGSCKAGASCQFSHDGPQGKPKGEGRGGGAGRGKGRGKGKVEKTGKVPSTSSGNRDAKFVCWKHISDAGCHNPSCRFAHRKATPAEIEEMNKTRNAATPGPAGPSKRDPAPEAGKAPVCSEWFTKGVCTAGVDCKLGRHPKNFKGKGKKD